MKAIKIAIVMILALNLIYSVFNWLSSDNSQYTSGREQQLEYGTAAAVNAEQLEVPAAEGLDLAGLAALVKEIRSGQELERRLNEKDSINNMDLNADNQVDYLFVHEYGEVKDKIGYSITAEPEKGEVQEVADVKVELNGDRAEIQVVGNEQIYGPQAIYNDSTKVEREVAPEQQNASRGYPMYSSFFFPHPLWISPWYFGFYPGFFSPFPVISRTTYVNRVNRYNTSTVSRGANAYQAKSSKQIASPNRGKTANQGIARSLKNPTSTQKQFRSNYSKNLKSGGFGKASRPTAVTRPSSSGSGSSFGTSSKTNTNRFGTTQKRSTGSLFGKTGRSFGSSGGSFRSSSFGSRSFSFGK